MARLRRKTAAESAKIRLWNHEVVELALLRPPRCVLDGFGQRRGARWERWQQELAQLLEWAASCDWAMHPRDLASLAEAAVEGRPAADWDRCWKYESWRRRCAKAGWCALDI